MTRMTGPDCAVMCNLINTHTHTHTRLIAVEGDDVEGFRILAGQRTTDSHLYLYYRERIKGLTSMKVLLWKYW